MVTKDSKSIANLQVVDTQTDTAMVRIVIIPWDGPDRFEETKQFEHCTCAELKCFLKQHPQMRRHEQCYFVVKNDLGYTCFEKMSSSEILPKLKNEYSSVLLLRRGHRNIINVHETFSDKLFCLMKIP